MRRDGDTAAAAAAGQAFRRAKIFRRTGRHSYAVQLEGCPGVVEVHCIEEDWGPAILEQAELWEDRLCKIGTRSMFAWDAKAERMVPTRAAQHVEMHEGVEIALGAYDPKRRAFVQCRLKGGEGGPPSMAAAEELGSMTDKLQDSLEVPLPLQPPPKIKRRGYKWMVWS